MIWRLYRRLADWRWRRARLKDAGHVEAWRQLLAIPEEAPLRYPDGHELAGHSRLARRTRLEFLERHSRLVIARPKRAEVFQMPQAHLRVQERA